jgi:iron-sulfur cluster repair protein YtfE (RIC family)
MNTDNYWLLHDHTRHEDLLEKCQDAIEIEDWDQAYTLFRELMAELRWHMTQEEEVVFPAYEAAANVPGEPTAALRDEHRRILEYMTDTRQVFASRDSGHVLDCLGRLEQLMVKHHEKEEDIFLPLAGLILKDSRKEILEKLSTFTGTKKS